MPSISNIPLPLYSFYVSFLGNGIDKMLCEPYKKIIMQIQSIAQINSNEVQGEKQVTTKTL